MSEPQLNDVPLPKPFRCWPRQLGIAVLVLLPIVSLVSWALSRAVDQTQEASRRSWCKCYFKILGLALHNYHDTYRSFPPAFVLGPDQQPWHSWRVLILPFLEEQALYDQYRFDEPWDGPNNLKLLDKMPLAYACPSRPCPVDFAKPPTLAIGVLACTGTPESAKRGYTSYAAVLGPNCVFRGTKQTSIHDLADGTSNTVLIGECTRTKIPWTKPEDIEIAVFNKLGDPNGFSSPHEAAGGGAHFLFGDGLVRFVNYNTPQNLVDAIFTRNGGETVGDF